MGGAVGVGEAVGGQFVALTTAAGSGEGEGGT